MKKIICLIFSIIIVSAFPIISVSAEKLLYVATVDGTLALHLSPDEDSYKIIDVPGCSELSLIKKEGTWGLVVFSNKCGWINLSFTRDTYKDAAEATGYESLKTVETNSKEKEVGFYTLPSKQQKTGSVKKVAVPPKGYRFSIIRETYDGWGLVPVGEEYLWVDLKETKLFISETEQMVSEYAIYYVYTLSKNGEGVALCAKAGESATLATIADCVKLTVRETENNYAYVSYNGINGWVNLDYTTKSFSDAQTNTGKAVNAEYKITGETTFYSVDIFNVPSNKIGDGAVVLGSIKSNTQVFVQRITADGWMLVNHNGVIGWIPPRNATLADNNDEALISPLEKRTEGYIATEKNSGLEVYPSYDNTTVVARIPECTRVEVIAEKDGRQYVYCDYASGWTGPGSLVNSYEKAVLHNIDEDKQWKYITKQDVPLMTLPLSEYLCNNSKLATVKAKTQVKVIRIVTTQKVKWGLIEINGKKGWINLGKASRVYSPIEITIFCLFVVAFIVLIVFALRLIIKLLKKKLKNKKETGETKTLETETQAEEISTAEVEEQNRDF